MNITSSLDFLNNRKLRKVNQISKRMNNTFYKNGEIKIEDIDNPETNQCRFSVYLTENKNNFKDNTRYQVRNSRNYPHLKVVDTSQKKKHCFSEVTASRNWESSLPKKIYNYSQLKSLMSQEVEKLSLPKKYQNLLQRFSGSEFAGELRSELAFVPNNLPKFSQKKRWAHKKRLSQSDIDDQGHKITILGNKINKNGTYLQALPNEPPQIINRKQLFSELKNEEKKSKRELFLNKKYLSPYKGNKKFQNAEARASETNQEDNIPLTGWADHDMIQK